MDYELFLQSNLDKKSLGEMLEIFTTELVNEKASFQSNDEEIVIGSKFFSLALEVEDISDIDFVRNHYKLDVNVCIRVQLFGKVFYQGLELLFKVIGKLIRHINGNLLFLEDGSAQLLRMENGQLMVNNVLDEYQTKYLTSSLLRLLGCSYIESELSN
ncbi:MAG TPA: hypothetical protein DEF35_20530 [Paenibacillus sp.]|uniref:hypothetical protein n=1 Tax=Paenibacillus TaxID=44249 RepID=UPI000BA0A657|nr:MULTISPECIES: hypothetical protein [Paenibacillus]OZQ71907.1 hypothetical protein CA599_08605 [Paenibacillus taichungensis]HBU84005.1 hypothetical protein [Paenibacillus sp.]